jgi:hypothetical protein
MKNAIVIGTNIGREKWLHDCLESLKVPSLVISAPGFEAGHIKWVYDNTSIERFIYLQDSIVIKNNDLLMSIFDIEGSVCLNDNAFHMSSYVGLYERETLSKMTIPTSKNKAESMANEEALPRPYIDLCEKFTCYSSPRTMTWGVFKHDRENLIEANEIFEKWKGNWGQFGEEYYQE